MQTVKIVIWQDEDAWLGYLQEYPDYWTQGESLDDVKEHLKDLYADLSSGAIPHRNGSDCRMRFTDLTKSNVTQEGVRRAALQELADQAQELELGY